MRPVFGLAGVTVLFLMTATFLDAHTQSEPPALIRTFSQPIPPEDDSIEREVAIKVDFGVARDCRLKEILLPLFDGNSLKLVQKSCESTADGVVIWSGRIEGQPASTAIFSASKNVLIGKFVTEPTKKIASDYYQIRFLRRGVHALRKFIPDKFESENSPLIPSYAMKNLKAVKDQEPTCTTDQPPRIDLLVVYTSKARKKANGKEAMKRAIDVYVKEANVSYEQSRIKQELWLVGTRQVGYEEDGDLPCDVSHLQRGKGVLKAAHEARDTLGADLVILITEYSKKETDDISCGQSNIMEKVSSEFSPFAFAVVPRRCADQRISFTHELGHLMGARHDWAVDKEFPHSDKPFPYSHGFVHMPSSEATEPGFRTIMATHLSCSSEKPCPRIPFWSNPDVIFYPSGVPTGVSDGNEPANDGLALKQTAPTVVNFRCHKD